MRYAFCLFALSLLTSLSLKAQQAVRPDTVWMKPTPEWPSRVKETSGLAIVENTIWTFNDSGGKPRLYAIDPEWWSVEKKRKIKGEKNTDWESIALGNGRVCVADFGNNSGRRSDLSLLVFPLSALTDGSCKISVEKKIALNYPDDRFTFDQKGRHDRDCEALTWVGDRLVMFTKNWKSRNTFVFSIDPSLDQVDVKPEDTLDVGMLVTGADYNALEDLMALTGYIGYRCYLVLIPHFSDEKNRDLNLRKYLLNGLDGAQVEAVAFYGDQQLLISTEKTAVFPHQGFILNYQRLVIPTGMRPEVCLYTPSRITGWKYDPQERLLEVNFDGYEKAGMFDIVDLKGNRLKYTGLGQSTRGKYVLQIDEGQSLDDRMWFIRKRGENTYALKIMQE